MEQTKKKLSQIPGFIYTVDNAVNMKAHTTRETECSVRVFLKVTQGTQCLKPLLLNKVINKL